MKMRSQDGLGRATNASSARF
uniref:Uncharacterized protein n=1 Tax=Arundo donax TaxID=35708 RepID=A0A0A9CJY9_ARUDO